MPRGGNHFFMLFLAHSNMPSFSSICVRSSPLLRYSNLLLQLLAIAAYAYNPPNNVPSLIRLRFYSLSLILALSTLLFTLQNNNHNMEFPNAFAISLVGIIQSLRTKNAIASPQVIPAEISSAEVLPGDVSSAEISSTELSSDDDTEEKPMPQFSMREISLYLASSQMNDFFAKLKLHLRDLRMDDQSSIEPRPLGTKGQELKSHLSAAKSQIRCALTNRFDTQEALQELRGLMKVASEYMDSEEANSIELLECVGRYIAGVFGLTPTIDIDIEIGEKGPSREESVAPVLDVFVKFRDEIRAIARNGGENSSKQLLKSCKRLRDDSLPPLGIRLEDVYSESGAQTTWKLEDAESILRDVECRRRDEEKRIRKEKSGILAEIRIRRGKNELISGGNTVEHLFNGDDLPAVPPLIARKPTGDLLD